MARSLTHASGIVGVSLSLLCATVLGCGRDQAPPPPPAQTAAPAATAQPAPAPGPSQGQAAIQIGMTGEQVQQILGAPAQVKQEGSELEWKYYTTQGKFEIKLFNNRVTRVEVK